MVLLCEIEAQQQTPSMACAGIHRPLRIAAIFGPWPPPAAAPVDRHGAMGGKRPQKLRVYGEPNINSSKAIPYSTFHQTWQSRISKENLALLSDEQIASFSAAPDLERPGPCGVAGAPFFCLVPRNSSVLCFRFVVQCCLCTRCFS